MLTNLRLKLDITINPVLSIKVLNEQAEYLGVVIRELDVFRNAVFEGRRMTDVC